LLSFKGSYYLRKLPKTKSFPLEYPTTMEYLLHPELTSGTTQLIFIAKKSSNFLVEALAPSFSIDGTRAF